MRSLSMSSIGLDELDGLDDMDVPYYDLTPDCQGASITGMGVDLDGVKVRKELDILAVGMDVNNMVSLEVFKTKPDHSYYDIGIGFKDYDMSTRLGIN